MPLLSERNLSRNVGKRNSLEVARDILHVAISVCNLQWFQKISAIQLATVQRRFPVSPRIAHSLINIFVLQCTRCYLSICIVHMICQNVVFEFLLNCVLFVHKQGGNKYHNSHCLKTSNSDNPRLLGF